jgi:hypothetical protein
MTQLKKTKKAPVTQAPKSEKVTLDNGIVVRVSRLSEQDQMRAAAVFDPKDIDRVNAKRFRPEVAVDLWKGNEAYLLFVVERSCRLVSEMEDPSGWLGYYRRNWRVYHLDLDELSDDSYIQAVYIRYRGMTTDGMIGRVTDLAMGIEREVVEPDEEVEPEEDDLGEDDEE